MIEENESAVGFFAKISFIGFLAVAHFLSIPLALIFGTKWDLFLSLFIPTYGFWVMVYSLLG
jgi:hypothetical protein